MKIEIQETFRCSRELIWEALNNSAALDQWLMKNDFKPVVGHQFEFRAKSTPGWNGICEAEVRKLDQPREAVWIWDRDSKHPWTLTWRIDEVPFGETRLSLVHDGFRGIGGFLLSCFIMRRGWSRMIRKHLPVVLDYMEKHGTQFPPGYLVPSRAKNC